MKKKRIEENKREDKRKNAELKREKNGIEPNMSDAPVGEESRFTVPPSFSSIPSFPQLQLSFHPHTPYPCASSMIFFPRIDYL